MLPQIRFSGTPEFQKFMSELAGIEAADALVQGVVIDLHPVWKSLWDVQSRTGVSLELFPAPHPWHLMMQSAVLIDEQPDFYDPEWRSERWQEFYGMARKVGVPDENNEGWPFSPFIVKICVIRPSAKTYQIWRQLQVLADRQPFFVTLEVRAVARAASSTVTTTTLKGGIRVDADENGTIGGFLDDGSGNIVGLTCGHVGQTQSRSIDLADMGGTAYLHAGTISETNYPTFSAQPHRPGHLCNPYVSGVTLHETDAAIVTTNQTFLPDNTVDGIGRIDDIFDRTQFQSGDKVWMTGYVSGTNRYYIGGYGVTYKILFPNGNDYCFTNLFEIAGRSSAPLTPRLAAVFTPRAQTGDSGAWICRATASGNYGLCGTLIAADDGRGIATFTDPLLVWANGLGLNLKTF
jgi:hypothetical protein